MRLGRVEATGGFFLLAAWLNYLDRDRIVPLVMAACLLHELGHYLAIRLLGGDVKLIRLTAVGAEMVLSRPLSYGREGAAALAGPLVNLMLAALFCRWSWGQLFAGLSLVLGCFNLLPVGRLDGGRLVFCVLSVLAGPEAARRDQGRLDGICTGALLAGGLWLAGAGRNITLLLVSLWLLVNFLSEQDLQFGSCHRGRKRVK